MPAKAPTKAKSPAKTPVKAKPTAPDQPLTMAQAAKLLGVTESFVMDLALGGAKRPGDRGEQVIEIDYAMAGNDLTFTRVAVERFLARCPVGDLIDASGVEKRLGIHRAQVSLLVYTGIPAADGRVVRLPVWVVGGREFVAKTDLDEFAGHHKAWAERKADREFRKRYQRPAKDPQPAAE
jgi:hypothetical protein